ncbi:MAG: shikimate dehydrogenase, partial [Flavobacteriales bacterium]|nr:shikimate dehydrogenase [Flavobacteriales bacterium]
MRIFGLIGERLGHSLSRELFEERFHREGLHDHHYRLFELDRVEQFTDLLRDYPDLVGLNVTIPYKRSVMPLLDAVDPLAAAVGAVNTIAIRDGRTTGYNTDVIGFREALPELIGEERPRALVLGGGGSSRAVSHVLRGLRIPHRVVSRSRE